MLNPDSTPSDRPANARLWLCAAAVIAVVHVLAYEALRDDAFITFRYVRNFVDGHGVVFNPGERVEGYSNFMLLMLLAGLHGGFGLPIVETAIGIGYASVVGTVILAGRYVARASSVPAHGIWAALLIACSGSFAAYGASGLETSLFTFCCVATLTADRARRPFLVGILAAAATMTRPDGAVLFLACALGGLFAHEGRLHLLGATVLGYATVMTPWTWWRLDYYGYLIPNQIEAKRGMELAWQLELGAKYVVRAAIAHAPLVLAAAIGSIAAIWRRSKLRGTLGRADATLALAVAGFVAFPVFTGGDWMPAYRFAVTAVVLASMFAARTIGLTVPLRIGRVLFGLVAAASLVISFYGPRMMPEVHAQNRVVEGEIEIGRWLQRLPPDTLTAAWANGAIPFYSGLPTIDLLGLTDEHIARRGYRLTRGPHPGHIAFDQQYVIERAPAVITFLNQNGLNPAPKDDRVDAYRRDYETVTFEFTRWKYPERRFANLWVRRSEVARIVAALEHPEAGIVRVE